jgi:RNA polymerase sigma-70 factor (ECF subfamily)
MSQEPVPTPELIARLRAGDQQPLAELFDRHRAALRRLVSWRLDRRLRGRVDPSDVLQDVYIDLVQRVPGYVERPTVPFPLWLRLLTGRRLLELHRQHLGAQMRNADLEISLEQGHWPTANPDCVAAHLTGNLTSPSQAALRAERETRLIEALDHMDPLDREVLVLRHFDELSNNDIAELFGIQKAAASHRYVRALQRLREALSGLTDLFLDAP